jgi:hypothetical protein
MVVPSNKSNELTVIGETGPYLLKYPVEPITQNSILTIEGARISSGQVTVHALVIHGTTGQTNSYTFSTNTASVSSGRRSFTFVPVTQGITLQPNDYLNISIENVSGGGAGLSNTIYFQVQ